MLDDPRGSGEVFRSLAASAQALGHPDDREEQEDCSEKSFLLDVPSLGELQGAVDPLEDLMRR